MQTRTLPLAFALAGAATASTRAEAPDVVASIKPVHALVAGVMAGVGEPALLVRGVASPHTYGLKPSDARQLQSADLIFWIGPGLEIFLTRALDAIPGDATTVPLARADGVRLLPAREGGVWEAHAHEDEGTEHEHESEEAGHGHDEDGDEENRPDLHLWLDPDNAMAMVEAIEAALSEADPANASSYAANADQLAQDLAALDRELEEQLDPVREAPFIVFHDAYQYFERHYGLNAAGSITISPDRSPGARRLQEIRSRLEETGAVCVFSEPQFEPALIATVTEGTDARTGVLDPIGAGLEPGVDLYPALLKNLTGSLARCLGGERS